MEWKDIVIPAGASLITALAVWFRFRKKDIADVKKISAEARKTSAEADSIIIDNFQGLLKTYHEENRLLQTTVNELKTEVFRLREEINKFRNG